MTFLQNAIKRGFVGGGSTIQTRTFCEIVVSHSKIIHQVTVLFVIILSIIFGFVNRQSDKKMTKFFARIGKNALCMLVGLKITNFMVKYETNIRIRIRSIVYGKDI